MVGELKTDQAPETNTPILRVWEISGFYLNYTSALYVGKDTAGIPAAMGRAGRSYYPGLFIF